MSILHRTSSSTTLRRLALWNTVSPLLKVTAIIALAVATSGCAGLTHLGAMARRLSAASTTTTVVSTPHRAASPTGSPSGVAVGACNDSSLSVPAPDNSAALRVLEQVVQDWVPSGEASPVSGATGNPALNVDLKPITVDSYDTASGSLAAGTVPAIQKVRPEPKNDNGTWLDQVRAWQTEHSAAESSAQSLLGSIQHAQYPLSDWSDLFGCLSAEAQWLASQAVSSRVLLYSSDFDISGAQNPSVDTSLRGVRIVAVQSCTDASSSCDSRRAQWQQVFGQLGASDVSWTRSDDLTTAVQSILSAKGTST